MSLKKLLLVLLVFMIVFSFVVPVNVVKATTYYYHTTHALAYAYIYDSTQGLNLYSLNLLTGYGGRTYVSGAGISTTIWDLTEYHQGNTRANDYQGIATTVGENFDFEYGSVGTATQFGLVGNVWAVGHLYKVQYSIEGDYVANISGNISHFIMNQGGILYFVFAGFNQFLTLNTEPYPITFDVDYTSFSCFTNRGIFTITRSNFYAPIFTLVKTSLVPGDDYVVSFDFCNASNLLTVQFKSTVPKDVELTLLWTVHGYDWEDNLVEISGNSPFTITCESTEIVPAGELVIISPATGANFETGTVDIPYKVVYGGDITSVSDPMYNRSVCRVDLYKEVSQEDGYVLDSGYSIVGNTTVWQGTATLITGGDGNYRIGASLMNGTVRVLTAWAHTFTIGEVGTGNVILDWLKALWEDIKSWFVAIMEYLFVPSSEQLATLNITGAGSDLVGYLPFLDLSSYGSSELVFIDFSNVEIMEGINLGEDKQIVFDLNNSFITDLFLYLKIGLDVLISIFVIMLIFKILA